MRSEPNSAGRCARSGVDVRFLRAIWSLPEHSEGAVTVTRLARHLGYAPGTVSDRIKRLTEQGLVEHERYRSLTLSSRGRLEALQAVRAHRLLRCLLADVLGYPWTDLTDDAEALEAATTDQFLQRADVRLGSPHFDPYGEPIPDSDGTLPVVHDTPLISTQAPAVTISRVIDTTPGVLEFLHEHQLRPGTLLRISSWNPAAGIMQAVAPRGTSSLGLPVVKALRVRVADSSKATPPV